MWGASAYDDSRGRRARDPPKSSRAYYDDDYDMYDRPPKGSFRYQDSHMTPAAGPSPPSKGDRHRRKPVVTDSAAAPDPRKSRRAARGGVTVAASDDDSDIYKMRDSGVGGASYYADRKSKHDAERKTGDDHHKFRSKRGTYEDEEGADLRRAKSYSPRRAAREAAVSPTPPRTASPQAPKSAWPDDDYGASRHGHRSKKGREQWYYDNEPAYTTHGQGYDTGLPRPPVGDPHVPYKSSPLAAARDEKPSKHKRDRGSTREKPYYGVGYGDEDAMSRYPPAAAAAGGAYQDPADYGAEEPPRRSRHGHGELEDSYGQPQASRGRHSHRHSAPVLPPAANDYEDPYDRAPPARHQARARDRQSMPPRTRYDNTYEDDDPYSAPPRRRASVSHGPDRYGNYGGPPDPYVRDPRGYAQEDRYGGAGPASAPTSGTNAVKTSHHKRKASKQWGKEAGGLFVKHALPVIKKEAVPFLTKAAQAYFEQQKR